MDRYRVDKVVGKGSFGQAILCARIADGKACIVKQVDTSKLPAKARREASKEATLLAKLKHPNIVGFWESFFHGASRDVLCIVMDYADGGDLSSCLSRRNGRLIDEEIVLDWFVQTTLALKHIHDRKILHRDLKTQNIFLTRSRVVKLGDFGIAKVLGSTFDLARTAIGTPYYMSPEICQEKRYNHKSDMWSLGCVLYEMTCLRHAFEGNNMRLLVMKICSQDPRPISARYSSGVRSLVAQLLKKDPHARPSTGAVLRRPLMKDKIGRFLSKAQVIDCTMVYLQAISQPPPPPPPLPLGPDPPRQALCPVRAPPPPPLAGRSTVPVSAARDQRALRPGAVARTSMPGGGHGRWAAREEGVVAARLPREKQQQAWRKNGEEGGQQKRKPPTSGGRGLRLCRERRRFVYDGDAKAQRPRRPSARAVSPVEEAGSDVRGACRGGAGAREERVFQRLQKMRGGGDGASPAGGGGGLQPKGVVGAAKYGVEEMGAALELARRRRAARAVFGFGSPDKDAEEDGQSNLEVKSSRSSRDCSRPGEEVATLCRESGERPTVRREPSAESGNTPPPSSESKPVTDRHHGRDGNRGTAPADDKGGAGCDGENNQAELAGDRCRLLGQALGETVPETVAETVPRQAERKGSVGGDAAPAPKNERKAEGVCRGELVSMDGRGQEAKSIAQSPDSDVPMGIVDAEGGCGDGGARGKVNLRVDEGWFQTFEAKMGAIKKQVEQIKSPPTSTPRRRGGDREDCVGSSRRDPVAAAKSHRDFETPQPPRYPLRQQREPRGIHNDGQGDDDDEEASMRSAGLLRPSGSSSSSSQQTARFHAAAAAVEAAAEVLAAIPAQTATSGDNQAPEVRRCRSDGDLLADQGDRLRPPTSDEAGDEEAGKPVEGVGGSGSGAARARPSGLGGPGGVKVAMTPAQRGSGGRAARQPPVTSRSERKPPRHAAALAAELGRHSDNRPRAKPRSGVRAPSGNGDDEEEGRGHEAHAPSAEERVQALRATRDRERGKLRALIAEKRRRSSIEKAKATASGEASPQGAAPYGKTEPDEPLLPRQEWSSPRDVAAAGGGGRRPADRTTGPPASEPRGGRCRGTPPHRVACPKGGARSASVNASPRRRRRPGSDCKNDDSNQEGELNAGARRDPARRQQSLRDFIAESRRDQRARRSVGLDDDEDDDDDGFSVLVPSGPSRRHGEGQSTDHDALAAGEEEKEVGEVVGFDDAVVAVVAARRNIGLDFEEEGRVWEAEGGGGEGAEAAGVGRVCAEGGGSAAQVGRGGVEEEKGGEEERVVSKGSSKSSSSSTLWNWEHAAVGEAVGAMEGVHPGLATYNSQRIAAAAAAAGGGMDGGGRAGQ
ncbi:unnamed protein product, partial [Ectocarpus fasciculatus]